MARRTCIALCGPRAAGEAELAVAEEVGAELARRDVDLVCGGLGGAMEAAARGHQRARRGAASPLVIGVLPGEDVSAANVHCDVVIPSGLGVARNVLVVRAADALILVSGGAGTLSEAALGWQLGKPLVSLGGSGGWAESLAGSCIDERRSEPIIDAGDAVEAVSAALDALGVASP